MNSFQPGIDLFESFLACPSARKIFDDALAALKEENSNPLKIRFINEQLTVDTEIPEPARAGLMSTSESNIFTVETSPDVNSLKRYYSIAAMLINSQNKGQTKISSSTVFSRMPLAEYVGQTIINSHTSSKRVKETFKSCLPVWKINFPRGVPESLGRFFLEQKQLGKVDSIASVWLEHAQHSFCKENRNEYLYSCSLTKQDLLTEQNLGPHFAEAFALRRDEIIEHGNNWLANFKNGNLKYPDPLQKALDPLKKYDNGQYEEIMRNWYPNQK